MKYIIIVTMYNRKGLRYLKTQVHAQVEATYCQSDEFFSVFADFDTDDDIYSFAYIAGLSDELLLQPVAARDRPAHQLSVSE